MLKPLHGYLLIEPIHDTLKVYIAEPTRSTSPVPPLTKGRVLKVGTGKRFSNGTIIPSQVEIGQIVRFERYYALEIKDRRRKLYLLDESYCIGVEEDYVVSATFAG